MGVLFFFFIGNINFHQKEKKVKESSNKRNKRVQRICELQAEIDRPYQPTETILLTLDENQQVQ